MGVSHHFFLTFRKSHNSDKIDNLFMMQYSSHMLFYLELLFIIPLCLLRFFFRYPVTFRALVNFHIQKFFARQ